LLGGHYWYEAFRWKHGGRLNQHNQSRRDEHGRKQRGAGVGVGVERRGDPLPLRASTPSGFAELRLGLPCLKRCQRARIISATRNRNQRPQRPLFHESVRSRQGAGHRTESPSRSAKDAFSAAFMILPVSSLPESSQKNDKHRAAERLRASPHRKKQYTTDNVRAKQENGS